MTRSSPPAITYSRVKGVWRKVYACGFAPLREREFFIDNLLVRIHLIIEMIWWTGLAPWEFEFPFPGSLLSTFLDPIPLSRRSNTSLSEAGSGSLV